MKTFLTAIARFMLKGYSLVLLLVLWLVSISVNASGGAMAPMYGVVAMYGVIEPVYGVPVAYCCSGSWDKAQGAVPNSTAGDTEYER
ncbi:MAG: hypothetical protein NTU83_11390 [Candidatus Hydrogenedentes bacterium]|nr:hypothetical protein [Candidatus Hydrogenedentota bacterium]